MKLTASDSMAASFASIRHLPVRPDLATSIVMTAVQELAVATMVVTVSYIMAIGFVEEFVSNMSYLGGYSGGHGQYQGGGELTLSLELNSTTLFHLA